MNVMCVSGGTRVTVYGQNLDSVAEPRISVTVVITNVTNDVNDSDFSVTSASSANVSSTNITSYAVRDSDVRVMHFDIHRIRSCSLKLDYIMLLMLQI